VGVRMTQHEFRTVGQPAERRNDVSVMPRNGSSLAAGSRGDSFGKIH